MTDDLKPIAELVAEVDAAAKPEECSTRLAKIRARDAKFELPMHPEYNTAAEHDRRWLLARVDVLAESAEAEVAQLRAQLGFAEHARLKWEEVANRKIDQLREQHQKSIQLRATLMRTLRHLTCCHRDHHRTLCTGHVAQGEIVAEVRRVLGGDE